MNHDRLMDGFVRLTEIMRRLRRECPWDRKQTPATLRRYLIEEAHEVLEALDQGDQAALRGELGDLLFQIWFHAEMASEGGTAPFDLADVVHGIADKLTRRHPHVFGDSPAKDAAAVRERWDELKLAEGRKSRLDGIPKFLPALLQAAVVQDKAASAGFRFPTIDGEKEKLLEEVREYARAAAEADACPDDPAARAREAAEYGDLLFALAALGRRRGLSAEDALRETTRKFMRRFRGMESAIAEAGQKMPDLPVERLIALWNEQKASDPAPGAPEDPKVI